MNDEFFVGYLKAPRATARFARRAAEAIGAAAIVVALIAAASQSKPGPGHYPAAPDAQASVIVLRAPVPLALHANADGSRRWLLIVNERKFGPDDRSRRAVPGAWSTANGRVIGARHAPSPGCFELADDAGPPRADAFGEPLDAETRAREIPLGRLTLRGEIIDPKCHFGAMKPGRGKTHRACAVRCISGGIPPLLMVRELAATGAAERLVYYILVAPDGSPVNQQVLAFVAEPVEIVGDAANLAAPDGSTVGDDALRVVRFNPATIRRL